jgi:histidine triad (HIT) family protein
VGTAPAYDPAVPTIFTRIINGELPGRFVHRDPRAVAFLSIAPLQPGHTLVVPVEEIDHWIDAPPDLNAHLLAVAQRIGRAQQELFSPTKVALLVAGLEVPHLHLHVVPIGSERDIDFANARTDPDPAEMDEVAERLRTALEKGTALENE